MHQTSDKMQVFPQKYEMPYLRYKAKITKIVGVCFMFCTGRVLVHYTLNSMQMLQSFPNMIFWQCCIATFLN
jgi:hypothetical protein